MKEILDSLDVGIMTYDNNLRIIFVNKQAQNLLGYKEEELLGFLPEDSKETFFVDKTQEPLLRQVSRTSNPIRNKIMLVRNKNGDILRLRIDFIKLASGGYLHILNDAKKEQELENIQIQTQTILDSIQNFVFILDNNKKIILSNKAFEDLIERDSNSIIGLDITKFAEEFQIQKKSIGEQNGYAKETFEATIVTKNGNKKQIIFKRGEVINLDGEVLGCIVTGVDITDLKNEQRKLEQQEKLAVLGQMAAGVVHEIKNPLTTIKGFSQLLATKIQDQELKKYITIIDNEVDCVNKVILDFLAFAKPQPLELHKISINEIVKSIYLMVETNSFLKGTELNIILCENESAIIADECKIKQVILNIVKNCLEAISEATEPKLFIKTKLNKITDQMQIIIEDNGKGMSEETKLKIGTPFFTTKEKGTGLGLSICYQIINDHGGKIEINSKLGKGSSFIISLPCA